MNSNVKIIDKSWLKSVCGYVHLIDIHTNPKNKLEDYIDYSVKYYNSDNLLDETDVIRLPRTNQREFELFVEQLNPILSKKISKEQKFKEINNIFICLVYEMGNQYGLHVKARYDVEEVNNEL